MQHPRWMIKRWIKRARVRYLLIRDGWDCSYCGCRLNRVRNHHPARDAWAPQSSWARRLTLDHRVPRSRGGSNRLRNLCLACATCNRRKGSMGEREFRLGKSLAERRESIERERRA